MKTLIRLILMFVVALLACFVYDNFLSGTVTNVLENITNRDLNGDGVIGSTEEDSEDESEYEVVIEEDTEEEVEEERTIVSKSYYLDENFTRIGYKIVYSDGSVSILYNDGTEVFIEE